MAPVPGPPGRALQAGLCFFLPNTLLNLATRALPHVGRTQARSCLYTSSHYCSGHVNSHALRAGYGREKSAARAWYSGELEIKGVEERRGRNDRAVHFIVCSCNHERKALQPVS